VCFSSDDKYIASGSRYPDNTVRVWERKTQKEVENPIILLNTEEEIYSCSFSNNNQYIVAGGNSGQILIYSIENLNMGIAIVTAHYDLNNNLSVRCKYCGKDF